MDKITEYKKLNASPNTVTRDVTDLSQSTGNIYETAVIIAKRADQITHDLKAELADKLQAFLYLNEAPDQTVFENEEQIDLSKQYEKIPKPVLLAMQEFLDAKFEFRHKDQEKKAEESREGIV